VDLSNEGYKSYAFASGRGFLASCEPYPRPRLSARDAIVVAGRNHAVHLHRDPTFVT
jgi:hypothetical protein